MYKELVFIGSGLTLARLKKLKRPGHYLRIFAYNPSWRYIRIRFQGLKPWYNNGLGYPYYTLTRTNQVRAIDYMKIILIMKSPK